MKKISDEEFSKLPLISSGKTSPFFNAIIGLHVGESLFISKKEWKGCQTPTRICHYIMKKFPTVKYTFGKLADGSGWAVKRVK
ncbi:MAG: hypothetical protein HY840_09650 [Bacteroidetes bacterium]|nr:hypothetical protein [Bacteroidota bacterium]